MPVLRHSLLALLTGAVLLSACAGPGPVQVQTRLSMTAVGRGADSLTVKVSQIALTGQRILAVAAEVERLWVQLRLPDGSTFSQWVEKVQFTGDQATATFTGLAPGQVHVTVRAIGAQDQVLGETFGSATIVSGQVATLDLFLGLAAANPAVPSAGPTSGLTASVTVVDGAVMSPDPLPVLNLPVQGFDYFDFSRFVMAPNGELIVVNDFVGVRTFKKSSFPGDTWRLLPNGRESEYENEPWTEQELSTVVCVDAQGRFYVDWLGVTKYSSDATMLTQTALPAVMSSHPRAIAVQDSGEAWVANGKAVSKISATGSLVGTFDLGSTTSAIVINQARNELWVALPAASKVVRLAANGQELSRVEVGLAGGDTIRDLAIDAAGNLWVLNRESGLLTKLDPDGRVLQSVSVARNALGLAIDDFGYAWVVNWREGNLGTCHSLYKVSPEGLRLGYQDIYTPGTPFEPAEPFHIEFDRQGNLFVPVSDSTMGTGKFVDFMIVQTLR